MSSSSRVIRRMFMSLGFILVCRPAAFLQRVASSCHSAFRRAIPTVFVWGMASLLRATAECLGSQTAIIFDSKVRIGFELTRAAAGIADCHQALIEERRK